MSTNNNRLLPSRNKSWYIFNDYRLSKHSPIQNISDRAVGTLPHFLQIKLLYSRLIRCNGCTFNSYFVFLNRLSRIDRNLIISRITMLDSQIKIFDIYIQIRQYQLVFNCLPDYASHLITVHLDDGICYFHLLLHILYQTKIGLIQQYKWKSGFYLLMGVLFDDLANWVVAVMLQGWVVT